jgi:hypothetical protein
MHTGGALAVVVVVAVVANNLPDFKVQPHTPKRSINTTFRVKITLKGKKMTNASAEEPKFCMKRMAIEFLTDLASSDYLERNIRLIRYCRVCYWRSL